VSSSGPANPGWSFITLPLQKLSWRGGRRGNLADTDLLRPIHIPAAKPSGPKAHQSYELLEEPAQWPEIHAHSG